MIGHEKAFPYLQSDANETNARLSPNGQWLAYQSDESKRNEIYVVGFPKQIQKLPISSGGGTVPVWSRDGRELYFLSADRKLMAIEIGSGKTLNLHAPKKLFDTRATFYDVSNNGRFLMTVPSEQAAPSSVPLTVVFSWHAGLKRP
jgi:eukaryotic-like serine/threonine-protein kinase